MLTITETDFQRLVRFVKQNYGIDLSKKKQLILGRLSNTILGELCALTPEDVNLENNTITINKTFQRINGRDVVWPPKTPKSNRVITIPQTLADCLNHAITLCSLRIRNNILPP